VSIEVDGGVKIARPTLKILKNQKFVLRILKFLFGNPENPEVQRSIPEPEVSFIA
jgi:hypothetical protein